QPRSDLAGIGIGFYGNSETNDGVGQATAALLDANLTLQGADVLTLGLLSGAVGGDLTRLEEALAPRIEFVAVVRNTRRQAEAVAQILVGLPFWGALGRSPSQLAHGLAFLEDYRMTVMSFFVLILSWGSLGLEMAAAVGLSDFCSDPDGFVLNLTQAKTELSPEILQYYLTCSQDVPNPFQQRLTMSQRALSSIHSQLHGLEREAIPQFPAAERNLVSVQGTLNSTESNFHQLVALLNCRGLHKVSAPAPPGGVPRLGPPLVGSPPAMVAPLSCGSSQAPPPLSCGSSPQVLPHGAVVASPGSTSVPTPAPGCGSFPKLHSCTPLPLPGCGSSPQAPPPGLW
uniref:Protein tweety homolog n=1 Tax=Gopherus agassizii TaxID=38772 RepID=A0A452GS49_9SAUR